MEYKGRMDAESVEAWAEDLGLNSALVLRLFDAAYDRAQFNRTLAESWPAIQAN